MPDKTEEAYDDGCRDAKAKLMQEQVATIYKILVTGNGQKSVLDRLSRVELILIIFGGVITLVIAPLTVILIAKTLGS